MPEFRYLRKHTLEPRAGMRYATTYVKQSAQEFDRLRLWLTDTGQVIVTLCDQDPDLAQWFTQPLRNFRKSRPGEYYTPEELLTDMIQQMALGRDLSQAMIDRWNRLCAESPWQIELVEAKSG